MIIHLWRQLKSQIFGPLYPILVWSTPSPWMLLIGLDTPLEIIFQHWGHPERVSARFQWSLTSPIHICLNPLPLSVRTQTLNMIWNFSAEIRLQISIATIPYINTKKISHKVKYFITTLIQDENSGRISIYLKDIL